MEIRKTGIHFGDISKINKYFIGFKNYEIDGKSCNIFLSEDELVYLSKLLLKEVEIINSRHLEVIKDIPVEKINPFKYD